MKKIILISFLLLASLFADDEWTKVVDLRGQWKFNLGDDLGWIEPDFDDSDWEEIFVPSPWEDEGFPGYDGYAWYRTKFEIKEAYASKSLYLRLWQIDDVDEVYVNGHFIGFSGSFPPHYQTAYNADRVYRIPVEYIFFDKRNTISIRVYDKELGGGILHGRTGIYMREEEFEPDIPLSGFWKFRAGDDPDWKETGYSDTDWENILVPAAWETQGYKNYDGYAWYRYQVYIPEKYRDEQLILFLGKIDDVDEVYFNGIYTGRTGHMPEDPDKRYFNNEWLEWRAYTLNRADVNFGMQNVIAVRVYDGYLHGGIYEGPIGIITREKYKIWRNSGNRGKKNFFELLFDD